MGPSATSPRFLLCSSAERLLPLPVLSAEGHVRLGVPREASPSEPSGDRVDRVDREDTDFQ